jgi:hypothetical protein
MQTMLWIVFVKFLSSTVWDFLLAERRCNGASEDEDGLDVCDDWGSLGIHPSLTSLKAFTRECLGLAAAPREQPPKRYLSLSRPCPSEFDPPPCFPIHWNLRVLIVYQVMSKGNEKRQGKKRRKQTLLLESEQECPYRRGVLMKQ